MASIWQRLFGQPAALSTRNPASDVIERAYNLGLDVQDRSWNFAGQQYFGVPTEIPSRTEKIDPGFLGVTNGAFKGNAVAFACMRARFSVFAEARFQFRRISNGRPGDLFGTQELSVLEQPWPNGTTGDLLTRMLIDADLAGNSYWTIRDGYMRRLRPDWVYIIRGVEGDPEANPDAIDSQIVGYVYWPGGPYGSGKPEPLLVEEVCHFAPIPDPECNWKGMSWLTPILREIDGDNFATDHKNAFFRNGATLQTVFTYDPDLGVDQVRAMKSMFEEGHQGVGQAYKTLHIGGGVDAKVIGTDLRQIDFSQVTGRGETRIAAAAGVPPIIVGLSEGLQAATYSNYGQARRHYADTTLRNLWRNAAGSLSVLLQVPGGAELWYDDRDIAFLREDKQEQAQILQTNASTMQTLINSGWTHESVRDAVLADGDWAKLISTGLTSVQLQPPSTTEPTDTSAGAPEDTAPAVNTPQQLKPDPAKKPATPVAAGKAKP